MRELDETRCAVRLGDVRPFFPQGEDVWGEGARVGADVAGDGEEAEVDLDLAGDEQAVLRLGPEFVDVAELRDRGVEVGALREGFLHGAFHQAVREYEAAGQGERLGD